MHAQLQIRQWWCRSEDREFTMNVKKITAGTAIAGLLGFGAVGLGSGLAQADPPHVPVPGPPVPGPGVNAGTPGNPLPPGQGFLPPPGHDRDDFVPADRDDFTVPDWEDVAAPVWAPPAPPPPVWAPAAIVVWNPVVGAWGIWVNGVFVQI